MGRWEDGEMGRADSERRLRSVERVLNFCRLTQGYAEGVP